MLVAVWPGDSRTELVLSSHADQVHYVILERFTLRRNIVKR